MNVNNRMLKDNLLCSDNKEIYFKYSESNQFRHGYVDVSKGNLVNKDVVHIKNVVKFHSDLLLWMKRFRGVATKYLENYLSWYRGLDEKNMNPRPIRILRRALC